MCSIVFEPLLFFVLFERSLLGVPGNLARIFQIIVIITLILRLVIFLPRGIRIVNLTSPLYINFLAYFLLLIFAGLFGLFWGAYDLPAVYQQGETLSFFSKILNSAEFRPFLEYIIAAYYIIYFSILPKYILKTDVDIIRFFNVFKALFIISFLLGIMDFIFYSSYIDPVPRNLADGLDVGRRFHGLAGEPRQAILYLVLGLAIFHLQAFLIGKKLSKWWFVAIIIAMLLTQSASGVLGIIAFLGLYMVFSINDFRQFLKFISLSIIIVLLLYLFIINSDRIISYINSAQNLWFVLESGGELPYLMSIQADSIYPLYDLTVKFRNFDLIPIFFGSGLGSASVANNVYAEVVFGTSNPNSQFVRILYESGLVGTMFFVLAFVKPIKYLTKGLDHNYQEQFIIYMLLLLGCSFAVRSLVAYIYLGVFIAAFNVFVHNVNYREMQYHKSS